MGTSIGLIVAAALLVAACGAPGGAPPRGTLAARFLKPTAEARMLRIVHGWSTDGAAQDETVAEMVRNGFGGCVTNVTFDNGYTSNEANWAPLKQGLAKLDNAGLTRWLYDEAGYPSGRAGRLLLTTHPEFENVGLQIVQARTVGDAVDLAMPPGKPLLVAAYPMIGGGIDLSGAVELAGRVSGRRLRWTAPAGAWWVVGVSVGPIYEGSQVAVSGVPERTPYVDLLNPATTREFLRVTHDRYAQHFGAELGRQFVSTFTDEPSLGSIHFAGMPYAVLPWSPVLAAEFRKRRGYDLIPELPALITGAGSRTARTRHDFWLTIGELYADSFFDPIRRWCAAHSIPSGGHLLLEENILHHVTLYGDMFRCLRLLDAPGIDCLSCGPEVPRFRGTAGMGADIPWNAARLASSAADLGGKTMVMCETTDFLQRLANPIQNVTETQFRGAFGRLLLGGITRFNTYSGFQSITPDELRRLNDWVGRGCEMLTGGYRRSDVAVAYPIETAWTRFTPSTLWLEQIGADARQVESTLRDTAEALYAARREFIHIDSRAIIEGRVRDGALTLGPHRWRVVVLPCVDTLPGEAWDRLAELVRSGGAVIAVGAMPANSSTDFPSLKVRSLGRELFGQGNGDRARLHGRGAAIYLSDARGVASVIDGLLARDVEVEAEDAPIRIAHRRIDGHEVYFLFNDSPAPWHGSVRLGVKGAGVVWDPETGRPAPAANGARIELDLRAYGGVFARYPTSPLPARRGAGRSTIGPALIVGG